ncbi:ABC transporter permease [Cypionkella sp.]|uniref:ABC transporter permease n=1 Tax=Cypionkella sp. TaxID=2811411 RepID=UPI002723B60A|nr:ABC transporter permease [Cypionkella sp.]MDO8986197.1 ABC transporter permease [Cypionkella sp.]MDP2050381.1 ABC transporter permease [Cypionkella sp.]
MNSVASTFTYLTKRRGGLLTVIGLIFVLVVFGMIVSDKFGTASNAVNILEQSTALALVSLGQTLVIITRGIDLSVGSMVSLASVLLSGITDGDPTMMWVALIAIMAAGVLVGLINAGASIYLGVHPLIVTLGTGAVLQGVTLLYTQTPIGKMPKGFDELAYGRILGLPIGAVFTIAAFVLTAIFLRKAPLGRYIYATGDDALGAQLMGLPRRRVLFVAYGFCGLMASVAAIFLVARLGAGQPYTGQNFTLTSITPVVVGGTLLSGGRGGVIGTLMGVYLVSLLNNLLNFMDISSHYQLIVQGLIVIIAVSVYVENKKRV